METERKQLEIRLNKTQSATHKRLAAGLMETLKQMGLSLTVVLIALFTMQLTAFINDVLAPDPTQHVWFSQHIVKFALGLLLIIIFSNGIYSIATLRRKLRNKWIQTAETRLREKEARFFKEVESDLRALMSREVR